MQRASTLSCLLGLVLLASHAPAAAMTDDAQAPIPESQPPGPATEPPRSDRLRDYVDQARAQRRAQIERLRAGSRDDSERAWQQHRESLEEQSRIHREQLDRWREPQFPVGVPPPGEWSNPWYYRGW